MEVRTLSLHQPWASLLVHGIKRIEGRHWTTDIRGRVWIHATSKKPDLFVIQELENIYSVIFEMEGLSDLKFPEYPTGVLVGCIDIVDCRRGSDIEASTVVPDNLKLEVGPDPICFLCENAKHLETPIKIRGWPKFWNLPIEIARSAETDLRPACLVDPSFRWAGKI